jgi:hypothetical protein
MGSWLDAPAFGWPDEDALMDMLKRIGRNRVWPLLPHYWTNRSRGMA